MSSNQNLVIWASWAHFLSLFVEHSVTLPGTLKTAPTVKIYSDLLLTWDLAVRYTSFSLSHEKKVPRMTIMQIQMLNIRGYDNAFRRNARGQTLKMSSILYNLKPSPVLYNLIKVAIRRAAQTTGWGTRDGCM